MTKCPVSVKHISMRNITHIRDMLMQTWGKNTGHMSTSSCFMESLQRRLNSDDSQQKSATFYTTRKEHCPQQGNGNQNDGDQRLLSLHLILSRDPAADLRPGCDSDNSPEGADGGLQLTHSQLQTSLCPSVPSSERLLCTRPCGCPQPYGFSFHTQTLANRTLTCPWTGRGESQRNHFAEGQRFGTEMLCHR